MARNKHRIYLAFYAPSGGGGHHHVALHYAPKNPAAGARDTRRLRAARATGGGALPDRWEFRDEVVPTRPRGCGALVLLGKSVRPADELAELLRGVSTARLDDCTSWMVEAVQVLIDRDIIEVPPLDLGRLTRRGGALADAYARLSPDERGRTSVPTANTAGERIESEVRGGEEAVLADNASDESVWC